MRLFFRLATQWETHAMSGARLGLKYETVGPTAAMMGIAVMPALFDDVTTMERAALAVWAAA